MGRLTTHVLDSARGRPAAGVAIEVWRVAGEGENRRALLKTARTNAAGRTDAPLLDDAELTLGIYELAFAVGDYFAGRPLSPHDVESAPLPFLDTVPIRFGVADPSADYHVPLLVSPWAYSAYRGG